MSQETWDDLLGPLTSEELHLLHEDWGYEFRGRVSQESLRQSLLNAVRDRPPTRAEVARIAMRSAARIAGSKEWRVYKLPGVPQRPACQEQTLERTAREVLGDLFGEDRLYLGAMNDQLSLHRVWLYVWVDGSEALMCAQAGARALLAATPPIEHEAVIVDSLSKALGLGEYGQPTLSKRKSSDVATLFRTAFRAEGRAGLEKAREQQAECRKRARMISGDYEREDGSVAAVGPGGSLGSVMGEGKPVTKKKKKNMKNGASPTAGESAWWRRKFNGKPTAMKVKCIVRSPAFSVVNVVIRGKNVKEGLKQLEKEGYLVEDTKNSSKATHSVQAISADQ